MLRLQFNPDLPKQPQLVTLGDQSYRILSTWRERLRGWYLDVSLTDGTDVALGVRVAAGGVIVPDINRWDDSSEAGGVLVAVGKDNYVREDLGVDGGINVKYMTRAEYDIVLAAAVDTSISLLVTP